MIGRFAVSLDQLAADVTGHFRFHRWSILRQAHHYQNTGTDVSVQKSGTELNDIPVRDKNCTRLEMCHEFLSNLGNFTRQIFPSATEA